MKIGNVFSRTVIALGIAGCVGANQLFGDAEAHDHENPCLPERENIFDLNLTAVTSTTTTTPAPQLSW